MAGCWISIFFVFFMIITAKGNKDVVANVQNIDSTELIYLLISCLVIAPILFLVINKIAKKECDKIKNLNEQHKGTGIMIEVK